MTREIQINGDFMKGIIPMNGVLIKSGIPISEYAVLLTTLTTCTFKAGWRLCLECACEGIGVESAFIGFRWHPDLRPMIMYCYDLTFIIMMLRLGGGRV
jgi:hypothetical protein